MSKYIPGTPPFWKNNELSEEETNNIKTLAREIRRPFISKKNGFDKRSTFAPIPKFRGGHSINGGFDGNGNRWVSMGNVASSLMDPSNR